MINFTKYSIGKQIRFIIAIVAIILLTGETLIYWVFNTILADNALEHYTNQAQSIKDEINHKFDLVEAAGLASRYVVETAVPLNGILQKNSIDLTYFKNKYLETNVNDLAFENIFLYNLFDEPLFMNYGSTTQKSMEKALYSYNLSKNYYLKPFLTKSYLIKNKYYFSYISPVYLNIETNPSIYTVLTYNFDSINRALLEYSKNNNKIFILENNNLIAGNYVPKKFEINTFQKLIKNNSEISQYITYNNKNHLLIYKKLDFTNWDLIYLIPKKNVLKQTTDLIPVTLIITFISIIIITIISNITIKSIKSPVEIIVSQINQPVTTENYKEIKVNVNNEISLIATHINEMLSKIRKFNKQILNKNKELYELELSKVQAELSYYQSQINPHFLYNTLESIRSIATFYNANEIEDLSLSMANIFRYAVKEDTIVSLKNELDCVKEYINIMQIRFPDYYKICFKLDGNIDNIKIPKMILQPIVENCFKHGFKEKKKRGTILLKGFKSSNYIIEIIDNGLGISDEFLMQINNNLKLENKDLDKEKQIGLKNINTRLSLCFGYEYNLKISSKKGFYTKISVQLPIE